MRLVLFLAASLVLAAAAAIPSVAADRQVLFREDFTTLDNWMPFTFPRIKSHSTYTIERTADGTHVLRTESNASASAMVYKDSFNVFEFRTLRWRWKVRNIYRKGDATAKAGDDFPLRIDIMFAFEPGKSGIGKRVSQGLARAVLGVDPPHSSLNYVWANREHPERVLPCPSMDHVKYILLRKGPSLIGTWQDEQVDIVADYREAFGTDPPATARIAVMNDSDNTGESSVSWMEYIDVAQ